MSYFVDIVEPKGDAAYAVDKLNASIAGLYYECCEKTHTKAKDASHTVNAPVLVQLWMSGALKMFVLYDGKEPVGLLIGSVYTPMTINQSVFHIEEFYVRDGHKEHSDMLVDYVMNALRFMGCSELWTPESFPLQNGWTEYGRTVTRKFCKA